MFISYSALHQWTKLCYILVRNCYTINQNFLIFLEKRLIFIVIGAYTDALVSTATRGFWQVVTEFFSSRWLFMEWPEAMSCHTATVAWVQFDTKTIRIDLIKCSIGNWSECSFQRLSLLCINLSHQAKIICSTANLDAMGCAEWTHRYRNAKDTKKKNESRYLTINKKRNKTGGNKRNWEGMKLWMKRKTTENNFE